MQKKHLFVALDDFGISPQANRHILELVRAGIINRVAVMPQGLLPEVAIQQLLIAPVALDIHLEINNPFRSERKLKDGTLNRVFLFFLGYFSGKTSVKQVTQQWEAQIQKFYALFGRYPDGLNSHEHTHFFPPYFAVMIQLATKYNISYIRLGTQSHQEKPLVNRILNWLRTKNLPALAQSGRNTSDFLISFDWLSSWDGLNDYPEESQIEFIFHPEREDEMAFLQTFKNL
ncbi:MAG: ChbG/HpnK family deacetylase [Candidatus Moraniibacteriota bacterium]